MKKQHYRSIFLSDIHLGTSDCQADILLEFLQSTSSDYLYLVGDIVDLQQLRHAVHWPRIKNDVVNTIFEIARRGTRVFYLPGNHDELFRDFTGSHYNGVDLIDQVTHVSAKGERILVLHGDIFDDAVRNYHWLESLGSGLYTMIMLMSRLYNAVRRKLGFPFWSFAAFVKYKFKQAVEYIENFELVAARHAASQGFDGIICGHIHHPNCLTIEGVKYMNTGDWVEHCTLMTEDMHGDFKLMDWLEARGTITKPEPTPVALKEVA